MIKEERRKKTHLYDDTVQAALPEAKVKMFNFLNLKLHFKNNQSRWRCGCPRARLSGTFLEIF